MGGGNSPTLQQERPQLAASLGQPSVRLMLEL